MCLAIPGKILSILPHEDPLFATAEVSFDGVVREVSLSAVPEAVTGQYVLVHVGMALSIIDEQEALATLELFKKL